MPARTSPLSSVEKACRILRSLSGAQTLRLADIAAQTAINKATALRILDTLAREGYARRTEASKQWSLGDEAFVLGVAASSRVDIRERARASLVRLAAMCEDSVLLSVRSGTESVCVDREIGAFPIRANYLEIGSRRPLGVGAGSMALLAWLPDDEIEAVLRLVKPALVRFPKITVRWLEREIQDSRERGHTLVVDRVVDRMAGVGVPVFGLDGRPVAGLSIAALSERITPRVPDLVVALRKESEEIAHAKGKK